MEIITDKVQFLGAKQEQPSEQEDTVEPCGQPELIAEPDDDIPF